MRELLLLPGWSLSPRVFVRVLPLLADGYRVTALPLAPAATLVEMAQQALAAAPPRAIWCGWSLGGMVAAQAALLAPTRVSALLMLASNPSFVARPGWPHAMAAADFNAFAAGLDSAVPADVAATLARFDALQCRGGAQARADLRCLREWRLPAQDLCEDAAPANGADAATPALPGVAVLRGGLQVLANADLRADIAALACPSHWLFGAHDALVPAAVAADIRRLLPAARVDVLAAASHVSLLTAAQQLANTLNSLNAETP